MSENKLIHESSPYLLQHAENPVHWHPWGEEALSKARDIGMRIAKNGMSLDNNFIKTVTSGSKGNFFNIAQIAGLLGQQNLLGERIKPNDII